MNLSSRAITTFLAGETPTNEDVLFGRGTSINTHEGNVNYLRSVRDLQEDYDATPDGAKGRIARAIVDAIYNEGGRFLKFNKKSGVWLEAPRRSAYNKASQALREGAPQRREQMHRQARQGQPEQEAPQRQPQVQIQIQLQQVEAPLAAADPAPRLVLVDQRMPSADESSVSDEDELSLALEFGLEQPIEPIDVSLLELFGTADDSMSSSSSSTQDIDWAADWSTCSPFEPWL